jgi:nucleoside-diphosphate-sugar epimerase
MPNFKEIVPIHGPERIGDIRHSMADISRIKATLGWRPIVEFENGIKELVAERLRLLE